MNPILLSIIFGITVGLSFVPLAIPLLKWFVFFPIFYLEKKLKQASFIKIFYISFLYALSLCIFGFYWIIYLFVEYGGIPYWLSILIFIPYSILLNSKFFLIFLYLAKIQNIFKNYKLIILPLMITLFDIFTPQVFNWYWGNLLTTNLYFSQIADIIGIYGLTYFYVLFSYLFFRFINIHFQYKFKYLKNYKFFIKWLRIYKLPIFLFLLIYIYGFYQYYYYKNLSKNADKVRVALIQPNAPLEKYGENKVTQEVLEELMLKKIPEMIKEAYLISEKKLDLVVLPESAIPYYTTQKDIFTEKNNLYHPYFEYLILEANAKYNLDVFFNEFAYKISYSNKIKIHTYNSSALFSRRGIKEEIYHKRILIAFGERIPLSDFLDSTGLIQFVPESVRYSRFQPGESYRLIPYSRVNHKMPVESQDFPFTPQEINDPLKLKEYFQDRSFNVNGYFMPLICYEIIQPDYVRDFFTHSSENVDFIVNITQDKWYGPTIESYQHLELGKIRSIEHRRSIIRSTNSGVSTAIDLNGEILKPVYGNSLTGQDTEEIQIFDIPIIKNYKTIYSKVGNSFLYIFFIISLILTIIHLKK